mmetsp:Transcript_8422/g.33961  ORF Transcript_8422/g.33961 Transcript_8422/m.33961 type:complete len:324 (-) Transcript_8422:36-1007(-)
MHTSTLWPWHRCARAKPVTTSPSPPTFATGAISAVTCTTCNGLVVISHVFGSRFSGMRIGGRSQNLGFSFGSGHTMAASSGGERSSPGPMGSRGFCCGWLKNASMPAIAGSISSTSAVSSGGGLTEAMMDLVSSMSSWSLEFSFCSAASCAMRSLSPPVSIPARSATGSASSTAGLASSPPSARTTSLDARDLELPPKLATNPRDAAEEDDLLPQRFEPPAPARAKGASGAKSADRRGVRSRREAAVGPDDLPARIVAPGRIAHAPWTDIPAQNPRPFECCTGSHDPVFFFKGRARPRGNLPCRRVRWAGVRSRCSPSRARAV